MCLHVVAPPLRGSVSDDPNDPPVEDDTPPGVETPATAHNLNDVGHERRRRKRIDNEYEQASKFWRDVFSTTVGRREMWGLLKATQPDGNPFDPSFPCGPNGFPQPEATWFRAGQYALGQTIWQSWLRLAPDAAVLMLQENDPRFIQPRKRPRIPD